MSIEFSIPAHSILSALSSLLFCRKGNSARSDWRSCQAVINWFLILCFSKFHISYWIHDKAEDVVECVKIILVAFLNSSVWSIPKQSNDLVS